MSETVILAAIIFVVLQAATQTFKVVGPSMRPMLVDGQHLLVVPVDLNQPVHQLLQVEADTGQVTDLTDPAVTPFKIANGDWSVSPVGDKIAFLSADDGNIWLLELPDR